MDSIILTPRSYIVSISVVLSVSLPCQHQMLGACHLHLVDSGGFVLTLLKQDLTILAALPVAGLSISISTTCQTRQYVFWYVNQLAARLLGASWCTHLSFYDFSFLLDSDTDSFTERLHTDTMNMRALHMHIVTIYM